MKSPAYYRWDLDEAYYYNWYDQDKAHQILIELADEIIPRETPYGQGQPPSKKHKQPQQEKPQGKATNGDDVIQERIAASYQRTWDERDSRYE